MKALLIVDVQNDFLPSGSLAVPNGDEVVNVANKLMDSFSMVVATRDWHPEKHVSFASSHEGKNIGDIVDIDGTSQFLWPEHCIQNTKGAEFSKDLKLPENATIISKGTNLNIDSYSTFFDNARAHRTGLFEILQDADVTSLFVMGLATDYCVKFSVLDACELGMETYVIEDGCRGVNVTPGDIEKSIQEMKDAGADFITSDQVLELIPS